MNLTVEELRRLLYYDPETGEFRWKVSKRGHVKAGDLAGCLNNYGYLCIKIHGRKYLASRLAYLYMTGSWPENQIDHIDIDRSNDCWSNLRPATRSLNHANKRTLSNSCGFKGVSRNGKNWRATICVNQKTIHLGTYITPEEAHSAYMKAAIKHFGEFARGD